MRKRIIGMTAIAASAVLLAGCGGGDGGNTGDADFSSEPTGSMSAWGFENADDVGQSRLDYAEEQLRKSIDIDKVAFLPKPFSVQELAEAARKALTPV